MKLYDQKGSWGVTISLEQVDEIACVASAEEDDFTIEITSLEINVEVSTIKNEKALNVWVYFGSNLEAEKYKLDPREVKGFIRQLKANGNVQSNS
ncbi:MAG: hypothetical protein ACJA1U_000294 [Bermanella sp.]|jgi:hypothetical protein